MNLLLDYGNSRLKWCLYAAGADLSTATTGACAGVDACKQAQLWRQLPIKRVWLASVAGAEATTLLVSELHQFGFAVQLITSQAHFAGLYCAYARAADLGVDRWLGVLAAHLQNQNQDYLIVSAGTALTIDALRAGGQHLGGYIVPGLSMMRAALATGGALLPQLDYVTDSATHTDFATNTHSAIAAGSLAALCHLIGASCRQLNSNRNSVKIIILGGNAEQIMHAMPAEYQHNASVQQHFVFNALAYIAASESLG